MALNEFRPPNEWERATFDRLLSVDFPGRAEIVTQLQSCVVRRTNDSTTLQIQTSGPTAAVVHTVPVEGRSGLAADGSEAGSTVCLLLFVWLGRAVMLQMFRNDGDEISSPPEPSSLAVFANTRPR